MDANGPLAALRYRDFRLFFFGQLISVTGTWMRNFAVAYQVYHLAEATPGASPELALSLIGLAKFLPILLLAPLSGLVADRVDRRRLLAATAMGALCCSLILSLATALGPPPLWLVYVVLFGAAACTAFEIPARQS